MCVYLLDSLCSFENLLRTTAVKIFRNSGDLLTTIWAEGRKSAGTTTFALVD